MVISQPKKILNKKITWPLERFFQALQNLSFRSYGPIKATLMVVVSRWRDCLRVIASTRACNLRWKEHAGAIRRENWGHSGISQHHQHCQLEFDVSNASVITTMQGKSKKKLNYDLKIREALEIRRHKCGPGKGLNEDMGSYVKTDIWDPVLHTLHN